MCFPTLTDTFKRGSASTPEYTRNLDWHSRHIRVAINRFSNVDYGSSPNQATDRPLPTLTLTLNGRVQK